MSLALQRRLAGACLLLGLLVALLVARSSWPFEREVVLKFRGDRSDLRAMEIKFVTSTREEVAGARWAFPGGAPPAVTMRPSLVRGVWEASARLERSDKTITVPVRVEIGEGRATAEIPLD